VKIEKLKDGYPIKPAKLILFDKSGKTEFSLDKPKLTIGRKTETATADIKLCSAAVSRQHGEIVFADGGYYYRDLDSSNGTYINGVLFGKNGKNGLKAKRLADEDVLRILASHSPLTHPDAVTIIFSEGKKNYSVLMGSVNSGVQTAKPDDKKLIISIEERSVKQKSGRKTLIRDINLTVNSGEMVLILGGSGAGKTTFMNAVMGYEPATGTILHGELDVYEDYEEMKYAIGFVPQLDLLRGGDTVYKTLKNAADMKLPATIVALERQDKIERTLMMFGLGREKETLVSKLSGGQRKRLNIAVEYISNPELFFLDEPDSGLDGIMARSLMDNLRTIANENKIVMVISHSPDRAADLFDKVIVLAKSNEENCGRLAYYGSIERAYHFFETETLEGIVKKINRPDEGGDGLSDFYIKKFQASQGVK